MVQQLSSFTVHSMKYGLASPLAAYRTAYLRRCKQQSLTEGKWSSASEFPITWDLFFFVGATLFTLGKLCNACAPDVCQLFHEDEGNVQFCYQPFWKTFSLRKNTFAVKYFYFFPVVSIRKEHHFETPRTILPLTGKLTLCVPTNNTMNEYNN